MRAATSPDASAIRRLVRDARLNPFGIDWERFLVAVDSSEHVLGCVQMKVHRDGSRELASLVVAPHFRRRGLGQALVRSMQLSADRPLWLMCASHLVPFYEQCGFATVSTAARMPGYFRRISRLVGLWTRFAPRDPFLAIMAWF